MKTAVLFACKVILFVLIFMSIVSKVVVGDINTPKKLQIYVMKRPTECVTRSRKGDMLHVHYTGKLDDGTEFHSSYLHGSPLSFTLGAGQAIKGWEEGLVAMCEGEQRRLVIPPDMGYGVTGAPPRIPSDATLTFHVELMKIERRTEL